MLPDGRAVVRIRRAEACHSCSQKSACQTLGGVTKDVDLVMTNPLGARSGDRVSIFLPEASVVKASAVLYAVPLLGLLGGAMAGVLLGHWRGWSGDTPAVLGTGVGLLLALLITRVLAGRMMVAPSYQPQMVRIEERGASCSTR